MLGDFGWSDVGSWDSVRGLSPADDKGNVVTGDVRLVGASNCLVKGGQRLIAVVGLDGATVVETSDAILVCSADGAQDVKKVHKLLEAENHPAALMHPTAAEGHEAKLRAWARNWLFHTALPLWSEEGLDEVHGGAYDGLDFEGRALIDRPKRFRVQARQIYTFAHAYHLGWRPGLEAMASPLAFIEQHAWREDVGGWAYSFTRDGQMMDQTADSYEQSFGLLALAWAYKVSGETRLREMATATMDFLDRRLRHPKRGFHEGDPTRGARRANPHMHLFEAAMAWMELHGDDRMARLADEMYHLYVDQFCVDGLLREYFNDDLSVISDQPDPDLLMLEPGHLMEWAYLLRRYKKLTGTSTPTIATLEAFADTFGTSIDTGLVIDHCHVDGVQPEKLTSRLWPQTEYIRLKLNRSDPREHHKAFDMLERVKLRYLNVNGAVSGHWHDMVDGQGGVMSTFSPTSSFYHIMGGIAPLVEGRKLGS